MNGPTDDSAWRNRFVMLQLIQIGGTALVLFALVLWQSDMIVEGGMPYTGLGLAMVGLVISFFGPRQLAKHWRRKDGR